MSWLINTPMVQKKSADVSTNVATANANVGTAFDSAYNLLQEERAYNSAEAQKNRDWQEYMSNTAYTRAVSDMRNAGLNPYLAYSQGGATVGGGATASHGGMAGSAFNAIVGAINNVLDNQTSNINTILNNNTAREVALMNNMTKIATTSMKGSSKKK